MNWCLASATALPGEDSLSGPDASDLDRLRADPLLNAPAPDALAEPPDPALLAVALALLCAIVVTGAAVRLSGSGLGCDDWPSCSSERVGVAALIRRRYAERG